MTAYVLIFVVHSVSIAPSTVEFHSEKACRSAYEALLREKPRGTFLWGVCVSKK